MGLRLIHGIVWISCIGAVSQEQNINQEMELFGDISSNMVAGTLDASRDVFSRTIAYDFSQVFFKRRSLNPEQRSVLLNGVLMNKLDNGRANWSNWGGLNDALRNQEVVQGILPSDFYIGKMGGTVNISSLAKYYSSGFKWSVASSNRSYATRWMITYGTPWMRGNWKINTSASIRLAEEGYRHGTPYEAYSFLCSADKEFSGKHFVNVTAILAHNRRGISSAMTEEVFHLKGSRYNSNWGYQDGAMRSARLRRTFEPIIQINYKGSVNSKLNLGAHLTYQWGSYGTSRIDYGGSRQLPGFGSIVGGGRNPDPTYYQNLPSYYLRKKDFPDYSGAYLAGQRFVESGQIQWEDLYRSNKNQVSNGNSIYSQYEDRIEDTTISLQGEIFQNFGGGILLRASLRGLLLNSERFAQVLDLLGGNGFLDVDPFDKGKIESQNDLRNPNRIVVEHDRFKYNYRIDAFDFMAFVRMDYIRRKIETFLATGIGSRKYRRTGLYENGSFPGNASYGKGVLLNFNSFNLKGGITYKFNGRHMVQLSAAILQEPPSIRNAYSNIRENHEPVIGLRESIFFGGDLVYRMRLPRLQMSLGAYMSELTGASSVSFYYADGLTGLNESETSAFVQEIKTNMGSRSLGTELGIQYAITDELKLKGAASIGSAYYMQNPELYLTSDDLDEPVVYETASLKGYRIPNGPQEAISIGLQYSDPKYWWLGVSFNMFKESFLQVAPVTRTKNFYTDPQGFIIPNYDPDRSRDLLKQEQLPDFNIVNLVGGKSWKIKNTYLGFFISVGNLFNTVYKTGGYEQSRKANYTTLLEDKSREFPLFSPKYWYGYGTTYFTSVYLRTR